MCYSKGVQAVTGGIILASAVYFYSSYAVKFHALGKKWLVPFLRNVIAGFAMIGGHQIFEYLSLETENQIVYKIGLLISISSMYFFLRSLEVLLNRNFRSWITFVFVGAIALQMFFMNMPFGSTRFFLHHDSANAWAFAWMLLLIYFHVCAWRGSRFLKGDHVKRSVIFYFLATLDVSLLLSVIYTAASYLLLSHNVCSAAPSVWCTFFVIQVFTLPFFLSALPRLLDAPEKKTIQGVGETIWYFIISAMILTGFSLLVPFFGCLSQKFVFP